MAKRQAYAGLLVCGVMMAASAQAQPAVLFVDGHQPERVLPMRSSADVFEALGLISWPRSDAAALEQAQRAFRECRDALYDRGETGAARTAYVRGRDLVAGLDRLPVDRTDLLRGLWLGVHLEIIAGDTAAGARAAALAVRVGPNQTPPASDYSPRVRALVAEAAEGLRTLETVGRPVGCEVVVATSGRDRLLLPGEHVIGLKCGDESEPAVGRRWAWDGTGPIDVGVLAVRATGRGGVALPVTSVDAVVDRLHASHPATPVVVAQADASGTWRVSRREVGTAPTAADGLTESALVEWVAGGPAAPVADEMDSPHVGTWWGVGLAGAGLVLLGSALGTRALANDAAETTNRGQENRLDAVERYQTATWALVGSGAALAAVGTTLAIVFSQRPNEPTAGRVDIHASAGGARLTF